MIRHRADNIHAEIQEVFEQMLAGHVTNITQTDGLGDLLVSYGCCLALVEIRENENSPLSPAQAKIQRLHGGCKFRVKDREQAINAARIIRARGTMLAEGGNIPRLVETC